MGIEMKLLMAALATLLVFAFTAAQAEAQVATVAPKEAYERVQAGKAQLVDVRESSEIQLGMAAPATWFPTSKIEADPAAFEAFLAKLPKGEVIFYCAAGGRAGKAASAAAAKGYQTANMGGYNDWSKAGLPTRKP